MEPAWGKAAKGQVPAWILGQSSHLVTWTGGLCFGQLSNDLFGPILVFHTLNRPADLTAKYCNSLPREKLLVI